MEVGSSALEGPHGAPANIKRASSPHAAHIYISEYLVFCSSLRVLGIALVGAVVI